MKERIGVSIAGSDDRGLARLSYVFSFCFGTGKGLFGEEARLG